MSLRRHLPLSFAAVATLAGCISTRELAAVKSRIDRAEAQLGAVNARLESRIDARLESRIDARLDSRIDSGGGDVNEPVTGWILAAGYALVPIAFVAYLVAHRWRAFRALKDRLRGHAPTADAGTDLIPLAMRTPKRPPRAPPAQSAPKSTSEVAGR